MKQNKDKDKDKDKDNEVNVLDYVYGKKFVCPVCDQNFTTSIARYGKSRIVSVDSDLKQNYSPFDPIMYDIVVCEACGYAENASTFANPLSDRMAELLLKEIKPKYWGMSYPIEITKDMALERFKIAMECNEVKRGKVSSRAYMYLKMAWICRNEEDVNGEAEYMQQALDNFILAYQQEEPPIAGMDGYTAAYLIGELCHRTGKESEALKWFAQVLVSEHAPSRIKNLALGQKDIIMRKRLGDAYNSEPKQEAKPKKRKKFKLF